MTLAYRWKKEAGIPMKRGSTGVRKNSTARLVTPEEWAKGCHHVARLLGVSPQAAWLVRNRLIAEGQDLPKLAKGRGRKLEEQPQPRAGEHPPAPDSGMAV